MDSVLGERLWRSLKYEEVHLKAFDTVAEARAGIAALANLPGTKPFLEC